MLHKRLFGRIKTDLLHLQLLGNGIGLTGGLFALLHQPWPADWLSWLFKVVQLVAIGLIGAVVVLEALEFRTRPDRRRFWDVPWPLTNGHAD